MPTPGAAMRTDNRICCPGGAKRCVPRSCLHLLARVFLSTHSDPAPLLTDSIRHA